MLLLYQVWNATTVGLWKLTASFFSGRKPEMHTWISMEFFTIMYRTVEKSLFLMSLFFCVLGFLFQCVMCWTPTHSSISKQTDRQNSIYSYILYSVSNNFYSRVSGIGNQHRNMFHILWPKCFILPKNVKHVSKCIRIFISVCDPLSCHLTI